MQATIQASISEAGQASRPVTQGLDQTIAGSDWHAEQLLEQTRCFAAKGKATTQSSPPTWSGSWSGAAGLADRAQLAAVRVPLLALVPAGADRACGRRGGARGRWGAAWGRCGAAARVGRHVRRPCGGRCSGGAGSLRCAAGGCCGAAAGVGRHVRRPCGGRSSGGARRVLCTGSRGDQPKLRQKHSAGKCCAGNHPSKHQRSRSSKQTSHSGTRPDHRGIRLACGEHCWSKLGVLQLKEKQQRSHHHPPGVGAGVGPQDMQTGHSWPQ